MKEFLIYFFGISGIILWSAIITLVILNIAEQRELKRKLDDIKIKRYNERK